jgi:hypothetical protein
MIASGQMLFLPDLPIVLIAEIVLMLIVLGIVWRSKHGQWHEKWLDYRFMAERFRSAQFMALANVEVSILKPPRHLSLAYSPKDWIVPAFSSVWRSRPRVPASDTSSFEPVKRFLISAWLDSQIHYHEKTSRRFHNRHELLTIISYILFGLTIVIALYHITELGPEWLIKPMSFLAIVSPALAASLTAIRTHRDYLRNSMRYAEMVRHLKELKDRMTAVQDQNGFSQLVRETEETMLHENEDWRVVVRFHTTEVPV